MSMRFSKKAISEWNRLSSFYLFSSFSPCSVRELFPLWNNHNEKLFVSRICNSFGSTNKTATDASNYPSFVNCFPSNSVSIHILPFLHDSPKTNSSSKSNKLLLRCYHSNYTPNLFVSKQSRVEAVEEIKRILKRIPPPAEYYRKEEFNRISAYLDDKLKTFGGMMDAYEANHVLKSLKAPFLALAFFQWAKKQPGFTADVFVYTTLIKIIGRSKLYAEMECLLEEMIAGGECKPDVVTFTEVIKGYGFNNDTNNAMLAFSSMIQFGIQPNEFTYSVIIDVLSKAGRYSKAMEIFKEMKIKNKSRNMSIFMDTVLCTSMIHICSKMGNVAEAESIFRSMDMPGCMRDVRTYSVMIDMYQKAGLLRKAIQTFHDMTTAGVRPNFFTLNVLLKAYMQRNMDVDHFVSMVKKEAGRRGMKLDVVWYNTLLDHHVRKGNLREVYELCEDMMKNGVEFDRVTYQTLMFKSVKERDFVSAMSVLKVMGKKGFLPSLSTYIFCFSSWYECQEKGGKERLWEMMEEVKHPVHDLVKSIRRDEFSLEEDDVHGDGDGDSDDALTNIRHHFDKIALEEMEDRESFINALTCFVWMTKKDAIVGRIWKLAKKDGHFCNSVLEEDSHFSINLHGMSPPTAAVALRSQLLEWRKRILEGKEWAKRVSIITGWGRRSPIHGKSQVKLCVLGLLGGLESQPFKIGISKGGALVADGEEVRRWLLNSNVASKLKLD